MALQKSNGGYLMAIVVIEHEDGTRGNLRVEYLEEKEHELFIAYSVDL